MMIFMIVMIMIDDDDDDDDDDGWIMMMISSRTRMFAQIVVGGRHLRLSCSYHTRRVLHVGK